MSDANLKNALLMSGGVAPVATNTPARYADRQLQYYDAETRAFTQRMAKYASDFMEAQIQGLDENDPLAWGTYRIRMADVVRPSSAIQRHFDDYKIILFESRKIEYIRPGAKIVTMGNTWLATNPINISGASGSGVVRRCNAVWNYLDYYGNVVSEPIIVENERANASASDIQQSQIITKGYFNVLCQYNDATRQIDTNTRFILGTGAYRVTGYSDFDQEFTGDYSTVRTLAFTVRYEEPNDAIDDMENHVAGGKTFSWDVAIQGQNNLPVGGTAQFSAVSLRCGAVVTDSEENPISYLWTSSDENILTVDENGLVTAVSEGDAVITATLEQNTAKAMSVFVTVTASEDGVFFTTTVPEKLGAYDSAALTAAYFEDGVEQDAELTWTFAGADESAYTADVDRDKNRVILTCYGYSETPLTVTAWYGSHRAVTSVVLEGL